MAGGNVENRNKSDSWRDRLMDMNLKSVQIDLRRAAIGGAISFAIILIGGFFIGEASQAEAYQLFQHTLPSTRSFCGTLILALGTILALMLTLLSLSVNVDVNIQWSHYKRVKQISLLVAITLITTIFVYLLLNIPITESDTPSIQWFTYIYYATFVISALLGGAFVTIILLLYNTIRDMINFLNPETTYMLADEENNQKNS